MMTGANVISDLLSKNVKIIFGISLKMAKIRASQRVSAFATIMIVAGRIIESHRRYPIDDAR